VQEFTKQLTPLPDISVEMMPKTLLDVLVPFVTLIVPLMFVTAYLYFVQFQTVILVSEKETLVKQHLLIMGMREAAYWYI